MSRVNTVLGPIPAEELGFVAVHEHIGYGMPGSELDTQWWKTPEQRYEETVPKLRALPRERGYGGATFVDATGICNGRDVDYYQSLSAKTGVHIVACTGFVGGDTALPFFAARERRLPDRAVRPRDHRRHRRHRQPGRHHQGRREPRLPDERARQAHLPRRRPGRAAPPGCRSSPTSPSTPSPRSTIFARGGPAARPRAVRARRRRRQPGQGPRHRGSPTRAAASASTPSATTSSCPTRRSGAGRRKERLDHFLRFVQGGHVDQRARLGRRQLQPARLAGREGPHRQLPLRGAHPRPARRRRRRGHDHHASSSTTPPTSCPPDLQN